MDHLKNKLEDQKKMLARAKIKGEFDDLFLKRRLDEEKALQAKIIDPSWIKEPTPEDRRANLENDLIEATLDKEPRAKLFSVGELNEFIKPHRKQLILFVAQTGSGKSTLVSNISSAMAEQKKKCLVITNEEDESDVYARIANVRTGINYQRILDGAISDEEKQKVLEVYYQIEKYVVVIDKKYLGRPEIVISVDGIKMLFDYLPMQEYSCVLLDYYQKVTQDMTVKNKDVNQIQSELSDLLDTQRKVLPGTICVLSQLKPDKTGEMDFENRLKGRKTIFEVCSECVEVIKQRVTFTTKWVLQKQRNDTGGTASCITGFDMDFNKHVAIEDADWQLKVKAWFEKRRAQETSFQPQPKPIGGES